jgi:hypothetical protein
VEVLLMEGVGSRTAGTGTCKGGFIFFLQI